MTLFSAMFVPSVLLGLLGSFSLVFSAQVKLGKTTLQGLDTSGSQVEFYGGIPFAEPPVGKLRFRAPVLKTRLDGPTFNATNFGLLCLQRGQPAERQSEDCLSLNIHRPKGTKPGAKLPILMWTYGGGFTTGGALFYNGSDLVARSVERGTPIIHVNYGYRLGPFGYPQGQEVYDERELNIGQKDMLVALEWVHTNIDVFGGDKNKITVFGESAGAGGIGTLHLTKKFEGLVRGAIMESGSANALPLYNHTEREWVWQNFIKNIPSCVSTALSGASLDCLRNATEAELKKSYLEGIPGGPDFFKRGTWKPTLDKGPGSLVPDFPSRLYSQGEFAKMPLLSGTNLDEATALGDAGAARNPNYTETDLKRAVVDIYLPAVVEAPRLDGAVSRLLDLYPKDPALGSPYGTGDELFGLPAIFKRAASLWGDMQFTAPYRQWMHTVIKHGQPAYGYLFTQPQNFTSPPDVGVPHAAEMPYLFGDSEDPTLGGKEISRWIQEYWISFAVSQSPNDGKGAKRPHWPQYTKNNQVLLRLEGGNTVVVRDDFRRKQTDFLIANSDIFRR